jgi:hypothetical protein
MKPKTLYDKIIDTHVIRPLDDQGNVLLYIDRSIFGLPDGKGVTRETGGLEAQLARNSAAASMAAGFLIFITERKRREEAMMCSRFLPIVR